MPNYNAINLEYLRRNEELPKVFLFEFDGRRYSHIIDPKTGLGLTHRIACSVIAPDATTSDALATAMCVLGVEQGGKVLQKHYPRAAARWATPQGSQQHGLHQFHPHQR